MEEAETASKTLKRTVKDSVFTDLFGQKRYLIQLYRSLHPEDMDLYASKKIELPCPELYVAFTRVCNEQVALHGRVSGTSTPR